MEDEMEDEMEKEGVEAPESEEGKGPKGMKGGDVEQVAAQISERATGLMNGMQELGFVLSELGADPKMLEQLAGSFDAFMQTLQAILGGGEQPEAKGDQPVDVNGGPNGVPYDQAEAAGKNKVSPMVG